MRLWMMTVVSSSAIVLSGCGDARTPYQAGVEPPEALP